MSALAAVYRCDGTHSTPAAVCVTTESGWHSPTSAGQVWTKFDEMWFVLFGSMEARSFLTM